MIHPLLAANWKLNLGRSESIELAQTSAKWLAAQGRDSAPDVIIFPQTLWISDVAQAAKGGLLQIGIQHGAHAASGAWTGELSAAVASKELGVNATLVAHSERRQHFGETNATARKRLAHHLELSLHAVYCIGETLQERESNRTALVLKQQLRECLQDQGATSLPKSGQLSIAYEPVWAIGTGKQASLDQIAEVHGWIRDELNLILKDHPHHKSPSTRILYGGSVTAETASSILAVPHVGGLLVGGASLKAETWIRILESAPRGA